MESTTPFHSRSLISRIRFETLCHPSVTPTMDGRETGVPVEEREKTVRDFRRLKTPVDPFPHPPPPTKSSKRDPKTVTLIPTPVYSSLGVPLFCSSRPPPFRTWTGPVRPDRRSDPRRWLTMTLGGKGVDLLPLLLWMECPNHSSNSTHSIHFKGRTSSTSSL